MERIKVLHINTSDTPGGASQVATELVNNLDADCLLLVKQKRSQSKKVIQFEKSRLDNFFTTLDKGLWKVGVKVPIKSLFAISDQFNMTYKKLKKLKAYQEASIIHLHNIHGNYFDLKALANIASEKFIVWTLHDMWALTGGEAYTFGNDNYKKGIGKTPYLRPYPLQNPLIDRRQHFLKLKKNIYNGIADKITLVPVSNWLEKCVRSAWVYNEHIKVRTIYNGIDTSTFINHNQRNWTKPRILFFNIGKLFKGGAIFKNIVSRIGKDCELTIVGEPLYKTQGTEEWRYGKLVSESVTEPEGSIYYNHLPYINSRKRLSEVYNQTDILIFPSLAESFGLTALEAMACGVCVIGSDAGGIPEVLGNKSGYIFKSGNEEDLLDKIHLALKDLDDGRRKGIYAEKIARGMFPLEQTCKNYNDLYADVAGAGRSSEQPERGGNATELIVHENHQ